MKGLFSARIELADDALVLRMRILGIPRTARIFPSEETPKPKKPKQKKLKDKSPDFRLADGWRLLRTFHVRKAEVDIDTGSPIANGMLIPIGYVLAGTPLVLRVNIMGESELWLVLENRLYRIAGVILSIAFRRKRH